MLLGILCTIASAIGVVGFFMGNTTLLIIGAIAGIIENLVGITSGEQKTLTTAIVASVIGVIYALIAGIPIWIGILIGLCFESVIMGFLGWGMIAIMSKNKSL